ncbi:MAG: hypothetical protein ACLQNV_03770 [Steroidobacteraceae bacterium]|jgi:hypothetical protein
MAVVRIIWSLKRVINVRYAPSIPHSANHDPFLTLAGGSYGKVN